ncbi:MAG: PCYCGC motif-containing (lipo)protein [Chloroflexota bacterium]
MLRDAADHHSRRRALELLSPLVGIALGACSGTGASPGSPANTILVARPDRNEWPDRFWKAAPEVQEAYRYALAHPDILQYMPCFCGCGVQGHRSNRDCYIRDVRTDGAVVLDPMSFG